MRNFYILFVDYKSRNTVESNSAVNIDNDSS